VPPPTIEEAVRLGIAPGKSTTRTGLSPLRPFSHRMVFFTCYGMPQYVIERDIPGAGRMTESEIRDVSLRSLEVLKGMGPQIQWLYSYVTDEKVYCVYLAPDESAIREHARQLGVPASRISAVRHLIDPQKYQ
jgi:Nickel responsive protein SCO4226-like